MLNVFLVIFIAMACAGCAQIVDAPKKLWGSSTMALERASVEGLHKTYACTFLECYEAVLSLARENPITGMEAYQSPFLNNNEGAQTSETKEAKEGKATLTPISFEPGKYFDVFLKDPHKKRIVVMGISGNIDTTEVGIFFRDVSSPAGTASKSAVKIDITSLSSTAKRRIAQAIFDALDQRFQPAS